MPGTNGVLEGTIEQYDTGGQEGASNSELSRSSDSARNQLDVIDQVGARDKEGGII